MQHELEEMSKEKAAVEAHADLLEKALMKLSVDNSKPQSQADIPIFVLKLQFDPLLKLQSTSFEVQMQVSLCSSPNWTSKCNYSQDKCEKIEGLAVI